MRSKPFSKNCEYCGVLFWFPAYQLVKARFCSRRCVNLGTKETREPKRLLAIRGKKPPNYAKASKSCLTCKKEFLVPPSLLDTKKYCCKSCYSIAQKSVVPTKKYIRVTIDGRRLPEHRFVMEQLLGRQLSTREQVHHKNKDRHDNRPENLVVLDIVDHAKLHMKLRLQEKGQNATI